MRRARRARVKSSADEIKDYYHKKARINEKDRCLFFSLSHSGPQVWSGPQKTNSARAPFPVFGGKKKEKKGVTSFEV